MFNEVKTYLFMERLKEKNKAGDKFIYPFSKDELQWLANALVKKTAADYFSLEEINQLIKYLPIPDDTGVTVVEKGSLLETNRTVEVTMLERSIKAILFGIALQIRDEKYFAYRLRFSVKTYNWSIIGLNLQTESIQIIDLDNDTTVMLAEEFNNDELEKYVETTEQILEGELRELRIVVDKEKIKDSFSAEKARILNTFASYNKRIQISGKTADYYEIQIDYYLFEQEDILMLIDQIGERIYVIEPKEVRSLMKERIFKTLQLYK